MLKLRVKQVIYESKTMKTQKGQSRKKISKGSQKFTSFAQKFSRGPWVQERPKKGHNFTTLLSGSRKGPVGA